MHLDNLWFHRHQPEMHHFVHWTLSKPQSIAPAGFHMPMQFNAMKGLICSLCISLTVAQLHCCIVAQLAQLRTSPHRCTKHGTRPPHHTEPDNNLTNPQKNIFYNWKTWKSIYWKIIVIHKKSDLDELKIISVWNWKIYTLNLVLLSPIKINSHFNFMKLYQNLCTRKKMTTNLIDNK